MEIDDPIELCLTKVPSEGDIDGIRAEIGEHQSSRRGRFAEKLFLAAISGIPWVGAYISAAAAIRNDETNIRVSELLIEWLESHEAELHTLIEDLTEVDKRLEGLGDSISERIESPEYLGIVRKAFRVWDNADTAEKRRFIKNLITNSGGTRLCSDDVVRLFVDLVDRYHEMHFAVIRELSKSPGSTRQDVWVALYNIHVTEDSAEADLFKLIFRDLSTGGIIRQERDINQLHQFIKKSSTRTQRGFSNNVMKSAFDDKEAYVLTGMGKQFVHYMMNEVVVRIAANTDQAE